jgi:hypothetical protein
MAKWANNSEIYGRAVRINITVWQPFSQRVHNNVGECGSAIEVELVGPPGLEPGLQV